MYEIKCRELTGEDCDFVVQEESPEKAKEVFYAHGAESPLHKERYLSAPAEEKEAFGKMLDEHLAKQS